MPFPTQIQINDNTSSLVKADELNEKNITELEKQGSTIFGIEIKILFFDEICTLDFCTY